MTIKPAFDGWITLGSLGNKLKFEIPFKKHKHFNKMIKRGSLKQCVRLSKNNIVLMFDIKDPEQKKENKTIIGIDVGQKTILTCSDNQIISMDSHGHSYQTICQRLSRKQKGSKGFKRTEAHRANFIGWSINQLNLKEIGAVNLENIKNLRKGKRSSRSLSHWNYSELFEKLERKLVENGVRINKLSPVYTSQRCFNCGWVRKGNRRGKQFKCDKCSFEYDADLNASKNISLNLKAISRKERLQQKNKDGFYWPVVGEEPIVPRARKM